MIPTLAAVTFAALILTVLLLLRRVHELETHLTTLLERIADRHALPIAEPTPGPPMEWHDEAGEFHKLEPQSVE